MDTENYNPQEEQKRIKDEQKRIREENKRLKKEMKEAYALQDKEETGGGKLITFLVVFFIILIWLAFMCIFIRLDIGGIGSGVVRPYLKDVPVLSAILPPPKGSVSDSGEDLYYGFDNLDEAMDRIKELEIEIQAAQDKKNVGDDEIEELMKEVERLKTYEDNQIEFEKIRNEFFYEVVFSKEAPDVSFFKGYYESTQPEKSRTIFDEVVGNNKKDPELDKYVKAYSSMKPKSAAEIFDTMVDDLELVARILGEMSADDRGKILGLMDPDVAAQVTKIMEPGEN